MMLIRTIYRKLTRDQAGGSLPGVLIAIAVGAVLMGAFLSHVSTRMLATRATTDRANELYAADSGVEYAIWTILNDTTFRNQADANIGTGVSLSLASNVNGVSLSLIEVTALPLGEWTDLAVTPSDVGAGAAIAHVSGEVFALRGAGTTDFWRYNIAADSWSGASSTSEPVGPGGALVESDGDLFAFQSPSTCGGTPCENIWIFDGSWSSGEATPSILATGPGAALVDTGNQIYAFRGNGSTEFWRYSATPDKWNSRDDAPGPVGAGGSLAYDGGNNIYAFQGGNNSSFWVLQGNKWRTDPNNPPAKIGPGGSLAGDLDNFIYALGGNGSTNFWRYNIAGDFWQELASTPASVGTGGSLTYAGGTSFYALRGNGTNDFWHFQITPPRYDISVVAGDTTIDARVEIVGSTGTIIFWDIN